MLKTHCKEAPVRTIPRTTRRQKMDRRRRRKHKGKRRSRMRRAQRRARLPSVPQCLLRRLGDLLDTFSGIFTKPTGQRFAVLVVAVILTTGSRTILNVLRTVDTLAGGHASSYHRVLSQRRWSMAALARAWSASRGRIDRGRCRSCRRCTERANGTNNTADATKLRPN